MANALTRNIPNAITCCNLVSGCVATYFAFDGLYRAAFLFIVIGAVFDFFDGMSARLLGVSSPIGKELDSLADDVTFGVAPSAMIFTLLSTAAWPASWGAVAGVLPYAAFIMAAFSALRLAKFNLDERQSTSFIGLPTELPKFAHKITPWGWRGNVVQYACAATAVATILLLGFIGVAVAIAWYLLLSVFTQRRKA